MGSLNSVYLVFRRSLSDFRLILAILSGMIVATTLISSAPIYMDSMDQQGIRKKIDKVVQNRSENYLALDMFIPSIALSEENISNTDLLIKETINSYWGEATLSLNRYIKTNEFSFYKTLKKTSRDPKVDLDSLLVGYFQSFQTMDRQITYTSGLPPSSDFQFHPDGPLLEVSISTGLAEVFSIEQGDVFVGVPFPDSRVKLGLRVSGVFEANDHKDPIWGDEIEKFLMPAIPTDDVLLVDRLITSQHILRTANDRHLYAGTVSQYSTPFPVILSETGLVKQGHAWLHVPLAEKGVFKISPTSGPNQVLRK